MQILKRPIVRIFDALGYEVRRKRPQEAETSHFESCLLTLLSKQARINIMQIGANDGSINDPLHSFVQKHSHRVSLILVEPQSRLIEYLEKNYGFHKDKFISNCAIGPGNKLTLHSVREAYWRQLSIPYAKDWPAYRAPSGVTSTDYQHVHNWLSRYYRGHCALSEMIESVSVDCMDAASLLNRANLFHTLDVLQVDTEGFDDEVIYHCNVEETQPIIINFEWANLGNEKLAKLIVFLESKGYILAYHGIDALAIRTKKPSTERS